MIVAGFDLSLNSSGVVILNEKGVKFHTAITPIYYVKNKKGKQKKAKLIGISRLNNIGEQIELLLDTYKPSYASIENYSFGSRGSAVHRLAEVGGVVRWLLIKRGIPFQTFSPQTLKKFMLGHLELKHKGGKLTSEEKAKQRKMMKQEMLNEAIKISKAKFERDDEADAFALALLKLGIEFYKRNLDGLGLSPFKMEVVKQWSKVKAERLVRESGL